MIKNNMQPGDTLKCFDAEDMVKNENDLHLLGYETEFIYERDGKKGYWILIIGRYGKR